MREQTKKMNKLLAEYQELKAKMFGNYSFVIYDNKDDDMIRYNQLFLFFNPQFQKPKDYIH